MIITRTMDDKQFNALKSELAQLSFKVNVRRTPSQRTVDVRPSKSDNNIWDETKTTAVYQVLKRHNVYMYYEDCVFLVYRTGFKCLRVVVQ